MIYIHSNDTLRNTYFLSLNRNFNKKRLIKNAKVNKRSYAGKFFERIYDDLITHVVNIEHEYKKYYQKEYKDIREFLDKKYNVAPPLLDKLIADINTGNKIFFGEENTSYDYPMTSLIFSDEMISKLNILLA